MFEGYIFILSSARCGHCQRLTPEWKKAATALKVSSISINNLSLLDLHLTYLPEAQGTVLIPSSNFSKAVNL